ncbi:exported hypothetical protein [Paraburkholderia piptadeniae]|uniref:Uncharacterized protein n=1 Tax=Paraburkholderia piptadeniae TaxID=1701573 RepID=A0A1N7RUR1_9BURK|nr:exported hypothetical protein [Paraburkholderia piptadeniae]
MAYATTHRSLVATVPMQYALAESTARGANQPPLTISPGFVADAASKESPRHFCPCHGSTVLFFDSRLEEREL